ncbi:hypothetical protein ACOMHN_058448 [Nucella lapillus]
MTSHALRKFASRETSFQGTPYEGTGRKKERNISSSLSTLCSLTQGTSMVGMGQTGTVYLGTFTDLQTTTVGESLDCCNTSRC